MLYLKRILVPTDLSPQTQGLVHIALPLAHAFEAEIHFLHVKSDLSNPTHPPNGINIDTTFQNWITGAYKTQHTRDLVNALPPDVNIRRVAIKSSTVEQGILEYANRFDFDLVIFGIKPQHDKGIDTPYRTLSNEVIHKCSCPVLAVKLDSVSPQNKFSIDRILVPTDFSDCSQHALLHAKEVASRFSAHIHLLHVAQIRSILHAGQHPSLQALIQQSREPDSFVPHLERLFHDVPGPEVSFTVSTVEGIVTDSIMRIAHTMDIDLIVISTHGLTGLRNYLLGSVTRKVVQQAALPVFTVKAFERSLVLASPSSFVQPKMCSYLSMLKSDIIPDNTRPTIAPKMSPPKIHPSAEGASNRSKDSSRLPTL